MTNYIELYYSKLLSGEESGGKLIKAWYKLVIDNIKAGHFFYHEKEAKKAIVFIENFCRHSEGPLSLQKVKLELWQKALISVIFGVLDNNDNRQFTEVVIVIGRGNGKTLLAAAISAYIAYIDDDYGKKVYFAAPKLEQANLCFNAFSQMIWKEPYLSELAKKRRSDIYLADTNTAIKPLAYNAKKSDGFNISAVICDEFASWEGDSGLKFYEVLRSSFGKRQSPLLIAISTAGYINDSVYDELIGRSLKLLKGSSSEKRLAPFLYQIDDVDRWQDIEEVKKANPNCGVSITEQYLRDEMAIAQTSEAKKAEYLTKYCNIKQNSALAWLSTKDVEKCCQKPLTLEDFRDKYAVVGVDLSQSRDLTAACVVCEIDGIQHNITQFFMPANKIEENSRRDKVPYHRYVEEGILTPSGESMVDYKDVFVWITNLLTEYGIYILAVGYDRYEAQYLVHDMNNFGLKTDDVYQGDNLYPIMNELESLVEDGKLNIGNNNIMKMHLLDSAVKMNEQRGRGRLVKVAPSVHIDGVAALLDAMTVKSKYYDELGEMLKNTEEENQ